jgi:hypothetical protein
VARKAPPAHTFAPSFFFRHRPHVVFLAAFVFIFLGCIGLLGSILIGQSMPVVAIAVPVFVTILLYACTILFSVAGLAMLFLAVRWTAFPGSILYRLTH